MGKACRVCTGPEPYTVNRLLGTGRGSRFIAARFPHVSRKDVKHHQEKCFPNLRAEVEHDLARLGGGDSAA